MPLTARTPEQLLAKKMVADILKVEAVMDEGSVLRQFKGELETLQGEFDREDPDSAWLYENKDDYALSPGFVLDLARELQEVATDSPSVSEQLDFEIENWVDKNTRGAERQPVKSGVLPARLIVERIRRWPVDPECEAFVAKYQHLRLYPDPRYMLGPHQHARFREELRIAFLEAFDSEGLKDFAPAWFRWRLESTNPKKKLPAYLVGSSVAKALRSVLEAMAKTLRKRHVSQSWCHIDVSQRLFLGNIRRAAAQGHQMHPPDWVLDSPYPRQRALAEAMVTMANESWPDPAGTEEEQDAFLSQLSAFLRNAPAAEGAAQPHRDYLSLPRPLLRDAALEIAMKREPEIWHGVWCFGRLGVVTDDGPSPVVLAVPLVVPDTPLAPANFTIRWAWLVIERVPVPQAPAAPNSKSAEGTPDPGFSGFGGVVYPAPALALLDISAEWEEAVSRASDFVRNAMNEAVRYGRKGGARGWPKDCDFRWTLLTLDETLPEDNGLPCALIGDHLGAAFLVALGVAAGWSQCEDLFLRGSTIIGALDEKGKLTAPCAAVLATLFSDAIADSMPDQVGEILSGPGIKWIQSQLDDGRVKEFEDLAALFAHLVPLGRVVKAQWEACRQIEFLGGMVDMVKAYQDVDFLREVRRAAPQEAPGEADSNNPSSENGQGGSDKQEIDIPTLTEFQRGGVDRDFDAKNKYPWPDLLANRAIDPSTNNPLWSKGEQPHFVLLGVPGGGKSTFTRYLTWLASQPAVLVPQPPPDSGDTDGSDEVGSLTSRFDPGARFALRVSLPHWQKSSNGTNLFGYLAANDQQAIKTTGASHAVAVDEIFWDNAFKLKRILLVLDGLDEVDLADAAFLPALEMFLEKKKGEIPIIITCRPLEAEAYRFKLKATWRFFTPQALDDDMIGKFIEQYPPKDETGTSVGGGWRAALQDQLGISAPTTISHGQPRRPANDQINEGLRVLAGIPMMLNIMCFLASRSARSGQAASGKFRIPNYRAQLYSEAVDALLKRQRDPNVAPVMGALNVSKDIHRRCARRLLAAIAIDAFLENKGSSGLINDAVEERPTFKSVLAEAGKHVRDADSSNWLSWLADYSGLIRRSPRGYIFCHKQFLEFMAGEAIAKGFAEDGNGDTISLDGELIAQIKDTDVWREVVRYALAVKLGLGSLPQPVSEVDGWLKQLVDAKNFGNRPPHDRWKCIVLAGDLLTGLRDDIDAIASRIEASTMEDVREAFIELIKGDAFIENDLSPDQKMAGVRERARAGSLLGWLGDPRPGVAPGYGAVWENGPVWFRRTFAEERAAVALDELLKMEFCYVPGESRNMKPGIPDFWIGRFPVTVAQYRLFATKKNYLKPDGEWWNHAGGWDRERGLQRLQTHYSSSDPERAKFVNPIFPAVSLTWFEAMAFCCWLDIQVRRISSVADEWELRLLTEAEWERAAQGGSQIPKGGFMCPLSQVVLDPDLEATSSQGGNKPVLESNPEKDRYYPWGGSLEEGPAHFANWYETGIGSTSAVGIFPHGKSAVAAEEMSGNVWEWCYGKYGKGSIWYALRGGSWNSDFPGILSCGGRYDYGPISWLINHGFRCGWVRRSAT